jgi:hypothetical protein
VSTQLQLKINNNNNIKMWNVESFKYLGNMLNYGRFTCEIKSRQILWQMLHLTRRGLFLQAKWTWK